jgi:hypothetical protein
MRGRVRSNSTNKDMDTIAPKAPAAREFHRPRHAANTAVVCVEISARQPAIYKQRPRREPAFKDSYDWDKGSGRSASTVTSTPVSP